jgi:hypothetical protein
MYFNIESCDVNMYYAPFLIHQYVYYYIIKNKKK